METSEGLDIPIIKLRPLRDRKISKREYDRILASIKVAGLLEPLIVYPDGDDYVIVDGVQRYRILLELGVEIVPCVLAQQRESFSGNRMVNRVSPVQENRMIEKSLEELDEQTCFGHLGYRSPSQEEFAEASAPRHEGGIRPRQDHADVRAGTDARKARTAEGDSLRHAELRRLQHCLRAKIGPEDTRSTARDAFTKAQSLGQNSPAKEWFAQAID